MEKIYYTISELVEMGVGSRYELYCAARVSGQTYAIRNGKGARSPWRFNLSEYLDYVRTQNRSTG